MKAGVAVLKPALAQADVPPRGVFVIGTVRGDLHDIGKYLVAVFLEGAGWKVVDLGIDCPPERFVGAIGAAHHHADGDAQVRDERETVPGIDGERREHGEHAPAEPLLHA